MNKLIFIVEDHPIQQKILKVHFEESLGNYTVKTFSNPEEIFDSLKEKPFAIVLDHFFGDNASKTGLHYLKNLKKSDSSIPVIYYTTLSDDSVRAEVMKLGAEDYIIKDSASLVRLRTALDHIHEKSSKKKKNIFQRLFK
jgi:DNA-binding NarL/FixJ family response regulator